ncbi:UDP-N-acetylglucosamine 1-carboxyvinyltransferase [Sesbania bispinosa]|nr:UDP-N-acetylglucosamine 1-carboxyvinyltransferase [Sesbania bispinosa]
MGAVVAELSRWRQAEEEVARLGGWIATRRRFSGQIGSSYYCRAWMRSCHGCELGGGVSSATGRGRPVSAADTRRSSVVVLCGAAAEGRTHKEDAGDGWPGCGWWL